MGKSIDKFKLKKELDQIPFKKFENYKNGTANAVFIQLIDEKKTFLQVIKRLISQVIFSAPEYILHKKEKDCIIFFFSQSYASRKDHYHTFEKIVTEMEDSATYIIDQPKHKQLNRGAMQNLGDVICWLRQMRKMDLCYLNKLQLVANLLEAKNFINRMEKEIDITDYTSLVTFCDAHLIDNYFTQYCSQKGLITATLQHGSYKASSHNENLFNAGFEGFISDYFLAWGEYTKKHAIESGIKAQKVICLGVPQYINMIENYEIKKTKNCFCVILDADNYEKDNDQMIKIADQFAEKVNLKYRIKAHPPTINKDYSTMTNSNNMLGYVPIYSTIEELIGKYDFYIISNSSVLTELIYLNQIVFHKTPEFCKNNYEDLKLISFETKDELFCLYNGYMNDSAMIKNNTNILFRYLCATRDIKNSYAKFLSNNLK